MSSDGLSKSVFIERSQTGSDQYRVDFLPEIEGLHKISVFNENEKEIDGNCKPSRN